MNPLFKNVLGVAAGIAAGSVLNFGLVLLGEFIIPPPQGYDLSTMEGLKAAMPLMEPKHFLMPLFAHAIGTFLAAYITVKLVASYHLRLALVTGVWFMIGGVVMAYELTSPTWFNITDLTLAYFPMAYLGARLAKEK